MFRVTTEVKGIAIDLDSFNETTMDSWDELITNFDCLFITSNKKRKEDMEHTYGVKILFIDEFIRNFVPNPEMQFNVLHMLGIKESELAYLSADSKFIANALHFYSCVIYVTSNVLVYEENPVLPDLICRSIAQVNEFLKGKIVNYLGEEFFSQDDEKPSVAAVPFFQIECDGEEMFLLCLGRYYGNKTYMRHQHPFSRKDSNDCVCSVPPRGDGINRFDIIVEKVAENSGLENISDKFITKKDYPTQKSLSFAARIENVKDAFSFEGNLNGKRVLLIDDIITTGTTLRECAKSLRNAGASEVQLLVFAINQKETEYCNANQPVIKCPQCGSVMELYANSNDGSLFYSCMNCKPFTIGYKDAKKKLLEQIHKEFENDEAKNEDEILDVPF